MERPRTSHSLGRSLSRRLRRMSDSVTSRNRHDTLPLAYTFAEAPPSPQKFARTKSTRSVDHVAAHRPSQTPSQTTQKHPSCRFPVKGTALEDQVWQPGSLSRRRSTLQTLFGRRAKPHQPIRRTATRLAPEERPQVPPQWLRRSASLGGPRHGHLSTLRAGQSQAPIVRTSTSVILDPSPPLHLHPAGGAAARAAAAAQNEVLHLERSRTVHSIGHDRNNIPERDSESGIGIDLRDHIQEAGTSNQCFVRRDPAQLLPEELFSQVLAQLDAASLLRTEAVSRRWSATARSPAVWRPVFHREHRRSPLRHKVPPSALSPFPGVPSCTPLPRDWKRMWTVNRNLQARWRDARAAAIYLDGHQDTVYCVQFDDHKIITGSRDRTVRVWDAQSFQCLRILGRAKTYTSSSPPSPLAQRWAHGQRPIVTLHPARPDAETLSTVTELSPMHSGSILCLQYDHELMVTGSSDRTLITWDLTDDYRPQQRLRYHSLGVLDVCFDSRVIVSCSKDHTICVWDRVNGALINVLLGHTGPVNAIRLRGSTLVSASGDGVARLWDVFSGKCTQQFPSHERGLACVESSPDLRTIYAGGSDEVIFQFDASTGELTRELHNHMNLVRSLHLDAENGRLVSGSYDRSVKVHDLATGDLICDFADWTTSWMLSAKSDYRRIVATSQDGRVVIMDFGFGIPGIDLLKDL